MRKVRGDDSLLWSSRRTQDEDVEVEDDDDDAMTPTNSAFMVLPSDSSSEDEDSTSDSNQHTDGDKAHSEQVLCAVALDPNETRMDEETVSNDVPAKSREEGKDAGKCDEVNEEDLDILLDEFRERDKMDANQKSVSSANSMETRSDFHVLVKDLDQRALSIDWSMRNALAVSSTPPPSTSTTRRGNNRVFLFGSLTDERRQLRPPSYIGGGIGMTTYDDLTNGNHSIPWPYRTMTSRSDWFTFINADSYSRNLEDYQYIQNTGDPNSLVLFVAHHPFVPDALLQLSSILYQTNQSQSGLSFLKRCLWVYESAFLVRFQSAPVRFMDSDKQENRSFFEALRCLIQVSSIAALWQTSLAVSQFLLALDPLRDPFDVLAVLDSYALCCRSETVYRWMIDLVESDTVKIMTRNTDELSEPLACGLCDMPNWKYSYALALYHVNGTDQRTTVALQNAIRLFPSVLGLLLETVEVDTTGRSLLRDWMAVLDKLTDRHMHLRNSHLGGTEDGVARMSAVQACDNIIKTFVKLSGKVWGGDDVLQLLYDNALEVVNSTELEESLPLLHPAVMRYARLRSSAYETRIQQLPQEANFLDPGLVAQAMVIEPNRPRLLRRLQAGGQRGLDQLMRNDGARRRLGNVFAGGSMTLIDPDLPLLELFWRSFIPWNHVEGVRRGAR